MNEKLKSEGNCLFCDKTYTKAGINRHLKTHLDKFELINKQGKSFLLKIEPDNRYGGFPYFISLWVDGETTIKKIDKFLRGIWLECCGHMSTFPNPINRWNGGMWTNNNNCTKLQSYSSTSIHLLTFYFRYFRYFSDLSIYS